MSLRAHPFRSRRAPLALALLSALSLTAPQAFADALADPSITADA